MNSAEVEIRSIEGIDGSGSIMIDAFPSIGLSAAIAGLCVVEDLKLHEIAAISSLQFPSVSVVSKRKPEFPARIYGSELAKVMVCVSEFTIPADIHAQLARSIVSWSQKQKCSMIISSSGIPIDQGSGHERAQLRGVGSNEQTRNKLVKAGITLFEVGVVSGLAAALLNEGRLNNVDVVGLVLEIDPEIPDTIAAAAILKAIDKLLPEKSINVTALEHSTQQIENRFKTMRREEEERNRDAHPSTYG